VRAGPLKVALPPFLAPLQKCFRTLQQIRNERDRLGQDAESSNNIDQQPPPGGFFYFRGPMKSSQIMDMPEDEFRASVVKQFEALHLRLSSQDLAIQTNTDLTQKVATSTEGIVQMFEVMQGGIRFLGVLGKIAKCAGYILAPIGAFMAIRNGKWPEL
jgi:hypothetical protein